MLHCARRGEIMYDRTNCTSNRTLALGTESPPYSTVMHGFTFTLLGVAATAPAPPFSLVAVGDWGGDGDLFPTTIAQVKAAKGMAQVAADIGAVGVLLLGDNFYYNGVKEVSSPRFKKTFEDVYTPNAFNNLPFHVIAGNHDWKGNVHAQIQYSAHDKRWHFPSLYYTLSYNFTASDGGRRTIDLLMIDTVGLAGNSDDVCKGCELRGPADPPSAEVQWAWLSRHLNTSTADFLWVAGHYPIYSAGQDGTTKLFVERLLPMLKVRDLPPSPAISHSHLP